MRDFREIPLFAFLQSLHDHVLPLVLQYVVFLIGIKDVGVVWSSEFDFDNLKSISSFSSTKGRLKTIGCYGESGALAIILLRWRRAMNKGLLCSAATLKTSIGSKSNRLSLWTIFKGTRGTQSVELSRSGRRFLQHLSQICGNFNPCDVIGILRQCDRRDHWGWFGDPFDPQNGKHERLDTLEALADIQWSSAQCRQVKKCVCDWLGGETSETIRSVLQLDTFHRNRRKGRCGVYLARLAIVRRRLPSNEPAESPMHEWRLQRRMPSRKSPASSCSVMARSVDSSL